MQTGSHVNKPSSNFHLSQAIVQKLNAVRAMLRRYVVAEGLLLVVLWILIVFWFGAAIDYLPVTAGSNETPHWLRIALLCLMAGGSLWIIARRIALRLGISLKDESLALLIERRYPELNNELITAVELREKREDVSNPEAHRAMLDRVHTSVSQRIATVHPVELFDWQPLWTAGVAVCFGLLVTLIAALGMTDWMGRWSRRLFTLSDEPWPRKASLRADGIQLQIPAFSTQLAAERVMIPFTDGIARVPRGAAAQLQISADASASQVPEVCTLYYRTTDGGRGRANLRRVGGPRSGWQQFNLDGPPLDGLTQDMFIDVVGLDARLRDLNIRIVEPAVITAMRVHCIYPAYLLDSLSARAPTETIDYRSGATIPEGTQFTLKGTASGRLSRVEYVIHSSDGDSDLEGFKILSTQPDGQEFAIPLGVLTATQVIEVRLIDEFGLSADQIPNYVITLLEDTIPEVDSQLEGIGLAVTPNAMLPLKGTVTDDHGIEQVTVELVVNESPPCLIPLPIDDERLDATIDLEQLQTREQITLEPGSTIGMLVSARDYYDLGGQQHVGRGQALQLSVVTPDQLLVMLDRQELELRQRLELITSELEQLREVLQTLKTELTPATSALRGEPSGQLEFSVALMQQAGGSETRTEQVRRLASLWAQQSVLQGDKSQQELSSIVARVDNLRLQLVNNRIDSYDRQERLLTKVHDPLQELLAGDYETMRRSLLELQTATLSGAGARRPHARPPPWTMS